MNNKPSIESKSPLREFFSRQNTWLVLHGPLVLLFTLSIFVTVYRYNAPTTFPIEPISFPDQSKWITADPGPDADQPYTCFYRREYQFAAVVKNAWIVVAPFEGYELAINGNRTAAFTSYRPTRPYQCGHSEYGQRIQTELPALQLNYPREFQWTGHHNHALPVYVDITPQLRQGKNVFAFFAETRQAPARIRFFGEIELATGEIIRINSDESWAATRAPRQMVFYGWNRDTVDEFDWPLAKIAPAPAGRMFRHVPPRGFTEPMNGKWMFTPNRDWSANGRDASSLAPLSYYYRTTFTLTEKTKRAALAVLGNRSYYAFINGEFVDPNPAYAKTRTGGQWLINSMPTAYRSGPELMDPDEVGGIFHGTRFQNPRHGDPTENDFDRYEVKMNVTTDRPLQNTWAKEPGENFETLQRGRLPDKNGPIEAVDRMQPKSLLRNQERLSHDVFGVASLLRVGENEIVIRAVDDPITDQARIGSPRFAVDLKMDTTSDQKIDVQSGPSWQMHVGDLDTPAEPVIRYQHPEKMPRKIFRGHANPPQPEKFQAACLAALISGLVLLFYGTIQLVAASKLHTLLHFALPSIIIAGGALLLEAVVYENHEIIYFMIPATWFVISLAVIFSPLLCILASRLLASPLIATQLLATCAIWQRPKRAAQSVSPPQPIHYRQHRESAFGETKNERPFFFVALCCLLGLVGFLRGYQIDFQTLDDDEYASIQAALAIAETGAPGYDHDIYYSRSPAHHYFAGLCVYLFGGDIWVLRMGQVFFGVLTGWVTYLVGAVVLRNRWVGLGAVLVFAYHPFLIFSSHIARFYQQQQFFAILVCLLFYYGFVQRRHILYCYATLFAFLWALLSQEISAVMGPSLIFAYFAFVRRVKASEIINLGLVAGAVVACLVVDFISFKTNCLTRVEGVSPNVESAVKPHFTAILNLLSMGLSYARQHVVLTFFVICGFLAAIRRKDAPFAYVALMTGSGIFFAVTLITGVSLRYQYWVFPLWILMAVYGVDAVARRAKSLSANAGPIRPLVAMALITLILLSFCPWRIPGSYQTKILGDSTGAFRYVKANMRPDDKVAATEPHPHAALIETGRSDFDIAFPLLWDFTHKDDQGYTRDRNGGAIVLASIGEVQKACAENDRIWFCINREKFRSRGKNIRWEYPSARMELFLRKNCVLMEQRYMWSVFLWDKNLGHFSAFRSELP